MFLALSSPVCYSKLLLYTLVRSNKRIHFSHAILLINLIISYYFFNNPLKTKKEAIQVYHFISFIMVQPMRLELTREFPYAPQTYASTSSAKAACLLIINKHTKKYNNKGFYFFSVLFLNT